jgi:branched-chain amino acid transport system substrate-binding protein
MHVMTKRLAVVLCLVLLLAPSGFAEKRRAVNAATHVNIRLGGLFSLTGDGASLGRASLAALELAAEDINEELDLLRTPYHVETDVEDTQLTASIARQKIEVLHGRGVNIVIGPQSSSEAAAVLSYANETGIVVISQGSTASTLAIAGDHLFRLAPNDKLEGAAQAALARADGIDTLVPLWRADAGNGGLHDSTKRSFEALGGTMASGVSYTPATTDFASAVAALAAAVHAARANPATHVAVYLASFEEAVDIFHLARLDPDLSAVRWYGGDGVTQSQAIVNDPNAAAFAVATTFTAPIAGLDEATKEVWQPVSEAIRAETGFAPDAYALSVYDAAWAAVLAAIEVENDASRLRDAFERNIQRYWGLTGPTILDAAGDRKYGNFDFWTVKASSGVIAWFRTAQYGGGHISR